MRYILHKNYNLTDFLLYHAAALRTQFNDKLPPHAEEKYEKSLTVVNRYTVGQDQNFSKL
jgi:hypothetical protein